MKVAVLGGGGAMGGLFGGYLARANAEVTLIDVASSTVDTINTEGLKIEEKDGSLTEIAVPAATGPDGIGSVDLIINFVKCYHTEQAVSSVMPLVGPDTTFLSLQNGWGNADRIAAIAGAERVMVGLTYHSATLLAPGHVKHPGTGMTYIGELDGGQSNRLKAVANGLRAAGFEVTASENILEEKAGVERLHASACRAARFSRPSAQPA